MQLIAGRREHAATGVCSGHVTATSRGRPM